MSKRIVAWDTETCLIRPGLLAPPLVCLTWQTSDETRPSIVHHTDPALPRMLRGWLEDRDTVLVGQNVAYDFAVVAERFPELRRAIFDAYDDDRVTDTKLRQQLLDIAAGVYRGRLGEKGKWIVHEYSLEALARRCAGIVLQKDAWRLSYERFIDVPLEAWPARAVAVQNEARAKMEALTASIAAGEHDPARDKALKKEIDGLREMVESPPEQCFTYAKEDARATMAVFVAQEKHAAEYLRDQYRQARYAFALHLSSCHGLRTNSAKVDKLRAETEADIRQLEAELVEAGLVRKDGSRDTKAAAALMAEVCREGGLPLRRTASHSASCPDDGNCHISLDADACRAVEIGAAGNDALAAKAHVLGLYAELSTKKKVLSNDCELLAKGTVYPIHPRYDIAETGRSTCSPNVQNFNRGKKCGTCKGKGVEE